MSSAERPQSQPDAPLSESAERTLAAIGQRIRDLRKARGMTLQGLAEVSGLSSSMLSLVERGLASPSIGSLIVISEALGKTMSDLLSADMGRADKLVNRIAEARAVVTERGVTRRVMKEDAANGITIAYNEYLPHTGSNEKPLSHDGYEYGILLEGSLTVEVDGVGHLLQVGDLISYASRRPHRIWNPGTTVARTIWFNTYRG